MVDILLLGLLNATLQAATLLFIASLGELITEKSGILNLGVEGMISVGAVAGFMTAVNTNNIFLAIIVGVLSSAIFASCNSDSYSKTRSNCLGFNINNTWFSCFIITRKKLCR